MHASPRTGDLLSDQIVSGQSSLIGGKAYSRPGVFYGLFFIALRYTALQNAAEYSIDLNGPPQKRKFIVT